MSVVFVVNAVSLYDFTLFRMNLMFHFIVMPVFMKSYPDNSHCYDLTLRLGMF